MYIKLPLKSTVNVTKIITLYYYEMSPKYKTVGESHDFWELVYVDNGEFSARAGDKVVHLQRGDMIFHMPNEYHNVQCDGVHSATIFIVTFECNSRAMNFFRHRVIKSTPELRNLISAIIDESARSFSVGRIPIHELDNAPIGASQMLKINIEMLLLQILRSNETQTDKKTIFIPKQSFDNRTIEEICKYLESNIYSQITLADICEHFHFGKSFLCSFFKENTGDTIMHYYQSLKIREAKRLLLEQKESVSSTAEKLNYDTPQYFSRIFKKYEGISPNKYKTLAAKKAIVGAEIKLKI